MGRTKGQARQLTLKRRRDDDELASEHHSENASVSSKPPRENGEEPEPDPKVDPDTEPGPGPDVVDQSPRKVTSISDAVRRALERSQSEGPVDDPPSLDGPVPSEPKSGPEPPEATEEPTADTAPKPEETATKPTPESVVEDIKSSPIDVFKNLLDMTHVPPGTEPAHFHSIAETLMQGFELCVTSKTSTITAFELMEVEFYWFNEQTGHIDPFTHAAEEQKVGENWYFHRVPRRGPENIQSTAPVPSPKTNGFKEGTRKGLDLTFGVPPTDTTTVAYGGILFRTIRNMQTKKVTSGPSLLVDEVLRSAGVDSLPTLVGSVWKGDTAAFISEPGPSRLFLRPVNRRGAKPPKMYTSPRVGLELSRIKTAGEVTSTHPRVKYIIRPYRFLTQPHLHGTVRPQTFYGLLQAHEDGQLTRAGIADVSGMKPAQVSTNYGYVEAGRSAPKKDIAEIIGERGKGVGPSPSRFLKMAGMVECIVSGSSGEGPRKKQKLGQTLTSMFAKNKK